jgi:hypothetical protein
MTWHAAGGLCCGGCFLCPARYTSSMFTTHYHTLMPDFATDDGMAIAHMGCLAVRAAAVRPLSALCIYVHQPPCA